MEPHAHGDGHDRLIISAGATNDWIPVWKAVERLVPTTVTSSTRLTALYELLRGWEQEDAERAGEKT